MGQLTTDMTKVLNQRDETVDKTVTGNIDLTGLTTNEANFILSSATGTKSTVAVTGELVFGNERSVFQSIAEGVFLTAYNVVASGATVTSTLANLADIVSGTTGGYTSSLSWADRFSELMTMANLFDTIYGLQPSTSIPYKRFATGGIATEASIFGEDGPEAAVPLPDGRSIPVDLRWNNIPNSDQSEKQTEELQKQTAELKALVQLQLESNQQLIGKLTQIDKNSKEQVRLQRKEAMV